MPKFPNINTLYLITSYAVAERQLTDKLEGGLEVRPEVDESVVAYWYSHVTHGAFAFVETRHWVGDVEDVADAVQPKCVDVGSVDFVADVEMRQNLSHGDAFRRADAGAAAEDVLAVGGGAGRLFAIIDHGWWGRWGVREFADEQVFAVVRKFFDSTWRINEK